MNSLFVYTTTQQIKNKKHFLHCSKVYLLFFRGWRTTSSTNSQIYGRCWPGIKNRAYVKRNRRWEFFSVAVDRCLLTKINSKSHFTIQHAMRNLNSARNTKNVTWRITIFTKSNKIPIHLFFIYIITLIIII